MDLKTVLILICASMLAACPDVFDTSVGLGSPHGLETSFSLSQRVHVPNNLVLGFWVIVIIVQVLGKYSYIIIEYLDP